MGKNKNIGVDFHRLIWGKAFLSARIFRFERSREEARELLRMTVARQKLSVLGYCIIPGEIMLLSDASREEAASMTRSFLSSASRTHNSNKRHEGSCWKGRPHVTLIQKGGFLDAALLAIDMLPVVRGLVRHPSEWKCSGFQELAGMRERYRIVDRDKIRSLSNFDDFKDFSRWHLAQIESLMINNDLRCFPFDALAIGDDLNIRAVGDLLPRGFREIRRCDIMGRQNAAALYASKRWENTISRNI